MTRKPKQLSDYIGYIREAAQRIRRYTRDLNEQDFYSNLIVQDAVVRNLNLIARAIRALERHGGNLQVPQDDLRIIQRASKMSSVTSSRNRGANLSVVWNAVRDHIGVLEGELKFGTRN